MREPFLTGINDLRLVKTTGDESSLVINHGYQWLCAVEGMLETYRPALQRHLRVPVRAETGLIEVRLGPCKVIGVHLFEELGGLETLVCLFFLVQMSCWVRHV